MPVARTRSRSRRSCNIWVVCSQARQASCSPSSSQRVPPGTCPVPGAGDTSVVITPGYRWNSQALNYARVAVGSQTLNHRGAPAMTATTAVQIPGYVAGTWNIDPTHSTVGFSVRHMMVSKVRGSFTEFPGEISTAEDPAASSVTATIDMDSIDTRQEQRDAHIRSADFFDVGNHTEMTFRSTEVRTDGADWTVVGDLTIKGITKPVELALDRKSVV